MLTRSRVKASIGATVATALLVLGLPAVAQATGEPAAAGTVPGETAADYLAADYLAGIYFGVGPVADRLPEIRSLERALAEEDPQKLAEVQALSATVIAHLEASRPGFVEQFRVEVVSGDHVRVREALRAGAEALAGAFATRYPQRAAGEESVDCAVCVMVAAVAAIVIVLPFPPVIYHDQVQAVDGDLFTDRLVHRLVTDFAG